MNSFDLKFKDCTLAFTKLDEDRERLPSVKCEIVLRSDTFTGSLSKAWFEHDKINQFFGELNGLLETCSGSATLEAMSAGDFSVRIFNSDSLGHFAAECKMKAQRTGNNFFWSSEITFEVDRTNLTDFVVGLSNFL